MQLLVSNGLAPYICIVLCNLEEGDYHITGTSRLYLEIKVMGMGVGRGSKSNYEGGGDYFTFL